MMSNNKPVRVFSMFSGIGGFEVGMSNSNIKHELVGYSEIDKFAIQVFEKQFKGVKNYGDATTINEFELPDFDLLAGGFPCQAFSMAGKRKGFEDTRGTLFFDIARILAHKKPKHFILENVKGLLSHDNGRTLQKIFEVLSDIGYMVQWQVLNSKNFGVPQSRERVYIVGHLRGTNRPQVFPIRQIEGISNSCCGETRGCDKEDLPIIMEPREITKNISMGYRVYRDDGVSATIKALGGGVGAKTGLYKIREATKKGYALAEEGDTINLSQPNSNTRRGRVGKQVAQTLDTKMQQHTIQDSAIRRLTPIECERLQGFEDNWTEDLSDTQRYKCLGNAVTTNVVTEIINRMYKL